nr:MAG TPA: PTS HPr component phosphorylation site [Caudoviricetes sp.]
MIDNTETMISTLKISINTISEISKFVETAKTINAELDLKSGRYIVDATSILGILSLDLENPITLVYPIQIYQEVESKFKPWVVNK